MEYTGSNQSNIKIDNQKLIIQLLFDKGEMSRAELSKTMASSKPTVSKNVEDLLNRGILVERGKADNSMGKKGTLIGINLNYGTVLGIDLSKHSFRIALSDLNYDIIFSQSIEITATLNTELFLKDFFEKIANYQTTIKEVCIAYPGVVGHNDKTYLTNVKSKEELLNRVIGYLKQHYRLKPMVFNDMNLAIVAEQQFGGYSHLANLYFISGDLGVGSAMIIDKKLYEGDGFAAGEIGFILPQKDQHGQYLSIEQRISVNAIVQRYEKLLGSTTSFEMFCMAANQNEVSADGLYQEIIESLAMAISNVSAILDIRQVIVSGRLFTIKTNTLEEIGNLVSKMTPLEITLTQSKLGKGTLQGAIYKGVQQLRNGMI